ncbi:MAG: hypothetical protein ABEJ83_03435, partial [Candidatus Nanohaloarchaea archaeon]
LLHLHECPVPRSMDGDVLDHIFKETDNVEYTNGYDNRDSEERKWTNSEQEELENQLKDMGYLE